MGLAFSAETEVFFEWAALFFWRNCDLISSILKSGKPLGADHLNASFVSSGPGIGFSVE